MYEKAHFVGKRSVMSIFNLITAFMNSCCQRYKCNLLPGNG